MHIVVQVPGFFLFFNPGFQRTRSPDLIGIGGAVSKLVRVSLSRIPIATNQNKKV